MNMIYLKFTTSSFGSTIKIRGRSQHTMGGIALINTTNSVHSNRTHQKRCYDGIHHCNRHVIAWCTCITESSLNFSQ